ncbi:hypothetical protein ASC77_11300 [Nocardioides sp. Root1257]|nr:hypothetical protein ASC77_11300 [Nocardioides sp. Root1257]KRC48440.1 hypothetical protein ASE24_11305 [Nocardioides sp. Root224]
MRPRRAALWRSAPLRLCRTPGWLALVLVAVTLLVASFVAPPLFAATARATALAEGLGAAEGAPYGRDSGDLRVSWDAVLPPDAEDVVVQRMQRLVGYGAPTITATGVGQSRTRKGVASAGGRTEPSVLWTRDGAIEALGGDEDAPGVWLAADVAKRLGLEVGDRVRVGLQQTFLPDAPQLTPTVLAGTYETAPGSSLPTALSDLPDAERWYLPADPDDPSHGTPLAIGSRRTIDRLLLRTGDSPLYLADLRLNADITPDDATTTVKQVQRMADDAFASTPLASALSQGLPLGGAELQVATGLPDIVFEADATADSARDQVRPYAVAGQVLAAALLVAGWVLLGRSRRREQLLASGLGLHPGQVAGLAALEVLLACLLAVPVGVGLACIGVVTAGPPTTAGLAVAGDDVVRAALAAGAALLLVAATAGLAAMGTDRMDRLSRLGRGRRAVPWTAALLAATVVVAAAVLTVDVGDRSGTALTMAFPVLVAASVAVLVARAVAWLRGRRLGRARAGGARWLATRRTGQVMREVTALTAVVGIALGLFAYALTVHRGIEEGVADKTAALAGATTSMQVAEDFRGKKMRGLVTPPTDGTTIVWRRSVAILPDFGDEPLMSIEPTSFAGVADWGGSGDLDAGRDLLPRLDRTVQSGNPRILPVLLAGTTDLETGDQGTLDFNSEFQIQFEVVGVVDAFPGSETETGNAAVVASSKRLFRLVLKTVNPKLEGARSDDAGAFASWVWSDGSPADLRRDLGEAGVANDGDVVTASEQAISNGLVASTWAAGYVLALGVVMLVLALAGALVLALRLADRDTVSDVLLSRMGWSSRELARSRSWEVAYAVATAVLAALVAGAVLVLGPTIIDAAAAIPPLTRPRPDVADLVVLLVVLVVTVLLAWLLGTRRASRRNPAEVLRGGG